MGHEWVMLKFSNTPKGIYLNSFGQITVGHEWVMV